MVRGVEEEIPWRSHRHKTKQCESPSQYGACSTAPIHQGAAHYQRKCNDYNKIHVFVKMQQYIDGFQLKGNHLECTIRRGSDVLLANGL